jgi:hypothetical protein
MTADPNDPRPPMSDENAAPETISSDALAWLTARVYDGRGAIVFGLTESGDVGVFPAYPEDSPALGRGDTASEAIANAYHRAVVKSAQDRR